VLHTRGQSNASTAHSRDLRTEQGDPLRSARHQISHRGNGTTANDVDIGLLARVLENAQRQRACVRGMRFAQQVNSLVPEGRCTFCNCSPLGLVKPAGFFESRERFNRPVTKRKEEKPSQRTFSLRAECSPSKTIPTVANVFFSVNWVAAARVTHKKR
jgi:hypothetical protein